MRTFLFLLLLFAAACSSDTPEPVSDAEARALVGTWTADDTTRFVFSESGEALWIFGDSLVADTFHIQYTYDPSAEPARIDLSGFDRGYLEGRTLFCIAALDSLGEMQMDCEPGGPGESGVRPDSFTIKSMVYRSSAD